MIPVHVDSPKRAALEGFDVVTVWSENSSAPEHSPLSCNGLAEKIPTNEHCLLASFDEAWEAVESGKFAGGEAGSHRIFAVYSVEVPWPPVDPGTMPGRG